MTVLGAILTLSGCGEKPAQQAELPEVAGRRTLQSFPVADFTYELALGPCDNGRCPFAVLLRRGKRLVDAFTLPVAAYSAEASAQLVDRLWGVDAGLQAWSTGAEQKYVGTVARPARLGPSTDGLLVTEQFGFETLKRDHVLLVRDGEKLNRAWNAEEVQGPTWSATALLPETGGSQSIAHWTGYLSDGVSADRITVEKLTWDPAAKRAKASPLPDPSTPLFVTVAAGYANLAQARGARAAKGDCLANLFLLSADDYGGLQKGKILLGAVDVIQSRAEELASATKQCGVTSRISTITAGSPAAKE